MIAWTFIECLSSAIIQRSKYVICKSYLSLQPNPVAKMQQAGVAVDRADRTDSAARWRRLHVVRYRVLVQEHCTAQCRRAETTSGSHAPCHLATAFRENCRIILFTCNWLPAISIKLLQKWTTVFSLDILHLTYLRLEDNKNNYGIDCIVWHASWIGYNIDR